MKDALLTLENIDKRYQSGDVEVRALDAVSLAVERGEFVAIMGQSGSGKSTLMNILGCLDRPSSGSYRVLGADVAELEPDALAALRRDTFGFVFQRYNLLATASAGENVEIPAIYAGRPPAERAERARRLLAGLGLADRTEHRPSELSGGQQQRVAIARALVNDPPVILADEPTGALDRKSGEEVLSLLRSLHLEGRTILLITHDESVARHADRIVRLEDGRIVADTGPAAPAQAAAEPVHAQVTQHPSWSSGVREALLSAARCLRVNVFRTALTLLGIVIGVAAVVTMLAVGEGSRQKVMDRISSMGTNLMLIRPGAPGIRSSEIATLVPGDAEAIRRLPNIASAVPERSQRMTARRGSLDVQTTVQGVGEELPAVRDWAVAEGQFFQAEDGRSFAPVAVLGRSTADALFPNGENPLGAYVLLRNVPFQVIGVMAVRGASPGGNDQDDVVLVPIQSGMVRLFGRSHLSTITVKVTDAADLQETQAGIEALLRARHGTEDFSVRNMASILETAIETQDTFTLLLGAVAAISLLVGGIGVMNIMLVSVVERTREIGIRMATGARMRDILLQFNIEAAVVCGVGGLLGIALGMAAGVALRLAGMSIVFAPAPALLAFGSACITGLVFGYLPARKAARLDPVLALASE